jgi:acylphosphatase
VGVEDFGRRRQIRWVMMAKKIAYRGKVQGVGFRYSVRQIAEGFTVSGHAANLPDGRVEVFLQGDRDEVEAMEKEIGESHLASFIREVVGEEVNAIAGTKGFQIQ